MVCLLRSVTISDPDMHRFAWKKEVSVKLFKDVNIPSLNVYPDTIRAKWHQLDTVSLQLLFYVKNALSDISLLHIPVSFFTYFCGARIKRKWESSYQWEGKQAHLFLRSPRDDGHLSCPGGWRTEKRKISGEADQDEDPRSCILLRKQQTEIMSEQAKKQQKCIANCRTHGWEGWVLWVMLSDREWKGKGSEEEQTERHEVVKPCNGFLTVYPVGSEWRNPLTQPEKHYQSSWHAFSGMLVSHIVYGEHRAQYLFSLNSSMHLGVAARSDYRLAYLGSCCHSYSLLPYPLACHSTAILVWCIGITCSASWRKMRNIHVSLKTAMLWSMPRHFFT